MKSKIETKFYYNLMIKCIGKQIIYTESTTQFSSPLPGSSGRSVKSPDVGETIGHGRSSILQLINLKN